MYLSSLDNIPQDQGQLLTLKVLADNEEDEDGVECLGEEDEEFAELFDVPKELPASRAHYHIIPLVEGAQLVNIRPYRHIKDVIEGLVKELLEVGVITPSNSPFPSPIAIIKKKDNPWRMCV
nr:hypothetical protein [Tanacetum cinerariifolium]